MPSFRNGKRTGRGTRQKEWVFIGLSAAMTRSLASLSLDGKEGIFVGLDATQAMAGTTFLALLFKKRDHGVVSEQVLCTAGVAPALGKAGILDEAVRQHVPGNVGHWSLQELRIVLHLKPHGIVYDAVDELNDSTVTPEYGGEHVVLQ